MQTICYNTCKWGANGRGGGKNRKDPINLFPLKFLSISCGMNASGAVLTVCLNHELKFLTHNLHRKKASSFLKAKR